MFDKYLSIRWTRLLLTSPGLPIAVMARRVEDCKNDDRVLPYYVKDSIGESAGKDAANFRARAHLQVEFRIGGSALNGCADFRN